RALEEGGSLRADAHALVGVVREPTRDDGADGRLAVDPVGVQVRARLLGVAAGQPGEGRPGGALPDHAVARDLDRLRPGLARHGDERARGWLRALGEPAPAVLLH